jgi:hypothetical protein
MRKTRRSAEVIIIDIPKVPIRYHSAQDGIHTLILNGGFHEFCDYPFLYYFKIFCLKKVKQSQQYSDYGGDKYFDGHLDGQ